MLYGGYYGEAYGWTELDTPTEGLIVQQIVRTQQAAAARLRFAAAVGSIAARAGQSATASGMLDGVGIQIARAPQQDAEGIETFLGGIAQIAVRSKQKAIGEHGLSTAGSAHQVGQVPTQAAFAITGSSQGSIAQAAVAALQASTGIEVFLGDLDQTTRLARQKVYGNSLDGVSGSSHGVATSAAASASGILVFTGAMFQLSGAGGQTGTSRLTFRATITLRSLPGFTEGVGIGAHARTGTINQRTRIARQAIVALLPELLLIERVRGTVLIEPAVETFTIEVRPGLWAEITVRTPE